MSGALGSEGSGGADEADGEAVQLQDFAIQIGEELRLDYPIGVLAVGDGSDSLAAALVGISLEGPLFCFPGPAWHRKATNRLLPPGSFRKPVKFAVAACEGEEMQVKAGDQTIVVWLGYLTESLAEEVDFSETHQATVGFGTAENPKLLPFAAALVTAAEDKFNYKSAESGAPDQGAPPVQKDPQASRLDLLEKGFLQVQATLEKLLQQQGPPMSSLAAVPKVKASTAVAGEDLLKGLDPGVVASAQASGVSTQSLAEMAKVLAGGPGKLEDLPRGRIKKSCKGALSEESSGESGEEETPAEPSAQMALAVTQLTKVVKHLAAEKKKPKNPLEQLLDGVVSSGASGEASIGAGRKGAAALKALKKAVSENPAYLYKTIEHNLREDFEGRTLGPGAGDGSGGCSIRGWLEHRSKINQYGTTRWSWILGGIWQSLIDGKVEEARARCALGVAAADQSAIDNSWIIAQTALLEATPPFGAFSQHKPPTATELHHSALLDSRWVEVYLNHIKDLDAFQEARKRLSYKQQGGGDGETKGGKGSWQTDEKIEKPGKGDKTERPGRKGKDKGTGKGAAAPANDA